ncbi:MAG: hypothetical protein M9894_08930 [Planctomycetes bacterium]|nr:hypothetical protein [Planctomycetota bacterium]
MATCRSCGGDNAGSATRCQYCDQPLQAVRTLEVHWQVRAGQGPVGRGILRVSAPASAGADPARVAAEAAFGAAITALGPQATAEQVQPLMAQRLPALLPPGHSLEALTVEQVSAFVPMARGVDAAASVGEGSAAAAGGCGPLACLALAMGLCCLTSGLFGIVGAQSDAEIAARLGATKVMTAEEASRASGPVAVENVLPVVGAGAPVTSDGVVCLWLSEPGPGGAARSRWVDSFRVGALEVRPDATTTWDAPVTLVAPVGTHTRGVEAIRADRPVTVAGDAANGVIGGGPGSVVSTRPSRDAVLRELERKARDGRAATVVITVIGALLLVTGWALRRRR